MSKIYVYYQNPAGTWKRHTELSDKIDLKFDQGRATYSGCPVDYVEARVDSGTCRINFTLPKPLPETFDPRVTYSNEPEVATCNFTHATGMYSTLDLEVPTEGCEVEWDSFHITSVALRLRVRVKHI